MRVNFIALYEINVKENVTKIEYVYANKKILHYLIICEKFLIIFVDIIISINIKSL